MIKGWKATALAVATLVGAATADAATLVSPPLVAEGANVLDCYLVNVGEKPRRVLIEAISKEGKVVVSVPTTLEPGQEDVARANPEDLPRYCRSTVSGPRADFRASILVRQDGVGAISALPAQ